MTAAALRYWSGGEPSAVIMVWVGVPIGQVTVVLLYPAVAFGVATAAVTGEWSSPISRLRAALVLVRGPWLQLGRWRRLASHPAA